MGKLIILSAPSGAGKTTICKYLLASDLDLEFSVSAASRIKRDNETDGKDYYFLSVDEFKKSIEQNKFLEWQEVYKNQFYGTLKSEIDRIWSIGKHVLFDVDVAGGVNIKNIYGDHAITIFIMPPSVDELEKRLRNRCSDSQEQIEKRVAKAKQELEFSNQFDIILVNDVLDDAQNEAYKIVQNFINT